MEVWTPDNTARQAVFLFPMALTRHQVLAGEEVLEFTVPAGDPGLNHLGRGSVLRVQLEGGAEFHLYRYAGSKRSRGPDDGVTFTIQADALWMDLRHGLVTDEQSDGSKVAEFGLVGLTPQEWLDSYILPAYGGTAIAFQAGVVELADPVDLQLNRASPLEALRQLEAQTQQQGLGGELQFRLNGAGSSPGERFRRLPVAWRQGRRKHRR